VIVGLTLTAGGILGCAGVTQVSEQTYLGASCNWAFRNRFPKADRLFNAFDFGHATLYEHLLRNGKCAQAATREIDGDEFNFITTRLLAHPPALPLEEHAIAPAYTNLVPELSAVFEWAHMLHRQLYDVLSDQKLDSTTRELRVAQLLRYYESRRDLALSTAPKSMELMEGAPYSLVFRRQDPKFNGLLWS
jgi:hypothetical protein